MGGTAEEAMRLVAGFVRLGGEVFAEIDPIQHVFVRSRRLVELGIRPRILDIGLHQGAMFLNFLNRSLLPSDGFLHQRGLFRGERNRGEPLLDLGLGGYADGQEDGKNGKPAP